MVEEMLGANQDKMDAWLTEKQDDQKETTACHEARKADTEKTEPDPGMMQSRGASRGPQGRSYSDASWRTEEAA
jgi:hypothetical protein